MVAETDLKPLQKKLGHLFEDETLLIQALTHGSLTKSKGRSKDRLGDYERLEFLGDRVLGLLIAEELYKRYQEAPAGQLSRRFNAQVQKSALAEIAVQIDLPSFVRVSEELRASGGTQNPSLLEDCVEALIAALYLDGGMKAAKSFVVRYWWPRFDAENAARKDPKSALQEWAAKQGKGLPTYKVVEEKGPDHNPEFTVEVSVEGCKPAQAVASSKRSAEKKAAKLMLKEVADG